MTKKHRNDTHYELLEGIQSPSARHPVAQELGLLAVVATGLSLSALECAYAIEPERARQWIENISSVVAAQIGSLLS